LAGLSQYTRKPFVVIVETKLTIPPDLVGLEFLVLMILLAEYIVPV
jgi:hypothetical protein